MPSHTSIATRSAIVLLAAGIAGLTTAAIRAPRPADAGGLHTRYGSAVPMANGKARTYVLVDGKSGKPVEVGVALSADALEGAHQLKQGAHGPFSEYLLELPADNPTPYRFVEVDWNPHGHGGPYTSPHFDFHFYRVPLATRNEIDPTDTAFATKAARLPAAEEMRAGYASSHFLLKTTPAGMTVPRMGLHWLDLKSPELPPSNKPFTTTFIMGSWDGQVIFDEPMITRDFILAQRSDSASADSIALPPAQRYATAGYYPGSYGITWDSAAREYRIALKGLTWKD
ncbi:MAG TPA: DUF5602 domain-containing protein [Gemmatimonadales bacterium]|jgi:hypothetical protein